MNEKGNFYLAIEECLIDPMVDGAMSLEPIEHEFSKEYRKKINEIIQLQHNWEKSYIPRSGKSHIKRKMKLMLLVAAIIIALGGITVAACEPLRSWIKSFFVKDHETYIGIDFDRNVILETGPITEHYIPSYVPEGFYVSEKNLIDLCTSVIWESDDGRCILYSQNNSNSTVGLDNERNTIEYMELNGYEAIYATDNEMSTLIWTDGMYAYSISGMISKKECLKMMESLKIAND